MDGVIIQEVQRFIVRKLVRHRIWQHKHTSIHHLSKGLPDQLRSRKEVRKAIDELLKSGFLLTKPTHYGLEVSLDIQKKKEIEAFIGWGDS
ncbi:MAG TPA: hypothetical protein VJK51_00030 [Candidatus Nanoarchaeia archaeon]|nr:hypothetical protein [Candidatus Nanoarchaeia archaeon]